MAAVEFLIYTIAATALVAVGPFFWLWRLVSSERILAGAIVGLLWAVSVVIVACEVRRRAITAVSLGVILSWLVVLVYVFGDLFV